MTLWLLLIIPIVSALVIMVARDRWARVIALVGSCATFGWAIVVAIQFPHWQAEQWVYWPPENELSVLPAIGVNIILGVDSVSLLLILLNVFLMPACVLGSWHAITERRREFYVWLMVLGTCVMGVFLARETTRPTGWRVWPPTATRTWRPSSPRTTRSSCFGPL